MTKEFGRATYSAHRVNGVLHIVATGNKPNLQTTVTIEQLPFFIFPPEFGLYFENPPIISPVVMPFHVESAFPSYPPDVGFVRVIDAAGSHDITIDGSINISPPTNTDGSNFYVVEQIGTFRIRIVPGDRILPQIFRRIYGPATYQQCEAFAAEHTAQTGKGAVPNNALVQADPASFKAWIDEMPGSPRKLIVTGDVMSEVDYQVTLVRAVPQGFNPAILLLHIDVTTPSGPHSNAIARRTLRYEEETSLRFTNVTVIGGGISFTVPVTIAH